MPAWPGGRLLLLTASSVLVAVLAVLWSNKPAVHSSTPLDLPYVSTTPDAAVPAGAPWYAHHAKRLAGNSAAVAAMQTELDAVRAAISRNTSLQLTSAALQGSRLPKKVTIQQAQQLLIDRQLLAQSLAENGFAAARVAALRQHYGYKPGLQATTDASRNHTAENSAQRTQEAFTQPGHHPQQEAEQQMLQQQPTAPSRGILIVGGSRTHLGNAYILLRMLREQLNCQLPVEVVYYGPQELDPAAAGLVRAFAAAQAAAGAAPITLIDGLAVHRQYLKPLLPHPEVQLTSWVAKVHALCWMTTFWQVLLLDSDNLPTQDPSILFQDPAFTTLGFMTWPDFWHDLWMEPAVYHLLNLTVPWEADPQYLAAESGQLLIDRVRHADVLEWLWLLNAHKGLVYRCLIGDKDTYRLAFELAGKATDYWQVPHPPRQLLLDTGPHKKRSRFIHLGMGQSSPDGSALLFMHRTARGKFFPWCAASRQLQQGTGGCQPNWLTMPVVQDQLMVSVPDPGSMRFDAGKIDTERYKGSCEIYQIGQGGSEESSCGVNEGSSSSSSTTRREFAAVGNVSTGPWLLRLPVCNYNTSQLPIHVIPIEAVAGLSELLQAVNGVFAEAAAVLAVPWVDRWKVSWGIL